MSTEWKVGDFVKVSLPHGTDNKSVHYATIEAVETSAHHRSTRSATSR